MTLVLLLMFSLSVSHMFEIRNLVRTLAGRLNIVRPTGKLCSIQRASSGAFFLYLFTKLSCSSSACTLSGVLSILLISKATCCFSSAFGT